MLIYCRFSGEYTHLYIHLYEHEIVIVTFRLSRATTGNLVIVRMNVSFFPLIFFVVRFVDHYCAATTTILKKFCVYSGKKLVSIQFAVEMSARTPRTASVRAMFERK